jgi:hypothetical protein
LAYLDTGPTPFSTDFRWTVGGGRGMRPPTGGPIQRRCRPATGGVPDPTGSGRLTFRLSRVVITGLLPESWGALESRREQPMVFNGVERLPTASNGRPATCGFRVPAGHRLGLDRVDTEVVAQRRPTALNCLEQQVNGLIRVTALPGLHPRTLLRYGSPALSPAKPWSSSPNTTTSTPSRPLEAATSAAIEVLPEHF